MKFSRKLEGLIVAILCLISALVGLYVGYTSATSGVYPAGVTYTVYKEGDVCFVKNAYGAIVYSGDPNTTINNALSRGNCHIFIKAGTYDVNLVVKNNTKIEGENMEQF